MDSRFFWSPYGLYGTSLLLGFASGFMPVFNIESFLLALAVLSEPAQRPLLLLITSGSHITGKALLYLMAQGSLTLPIPSLRRKIEKIRRQPIRWPFSLPVIFISALFGIPPFYLTTITAGAFCLPLPGFLICGAVGRTIRFAVLLYGPQWIRGMWP